MIPRSEGGQITDMKRNRKSGAFTLVEIMIVVLIIGILMAIAVPNFIRARETSRRNSCIANLKQMDSAKEQWAMDNKAASGAAVVMADIAGTYMKGPVTGPICPAGGAYTVNVVGTNPACSKAAAPDLHLLP
jgi:prepilin-type N-terminal cleavage/methylation domain-containing protein